jgi:WD40 repeat protein
VQIAPSRRFFATGGEDTAVRIWDVRTREMLTHLKNHTMEVTSLQFVPSAEFLYSASADKSVCLFDLRAEKMTERMTQFESHVVDLDVAGDLLVTATQDGHVQKFAISQGTKALASVKANEATSIAASPDRAKFAIGHVDGSVSVWDVASFKKIDTLGVHSHEVSDIRFFANDKVMSSGTDGGLAIITVQ